MRVLSLYPPLCFRSRTRPSLFGVGQSSVPFPSSSGSSDGARETVKCTDFLGGSSHANSPEAESTSEGGSVYFPRSLTVLLCLKQYDAEDITDEQCIIERPPDVGGYQGHGHVCF